MEDLGMKIIPLTTEPNQDFVITIPIDGVNKTFNLNVSYNTIGRYWYMDIIDYDTEKQILSGVPLIYSGNPASDIFEQYEYLNIGSAMVVKTSDILDSMPDGTNLGTDFVLLWGDTYV